MTEKEIRKRITEIACRVYDVDPNEPDPQQFAIEREIGELIAEILEDYTRKV